MNIKLLGSRVLVKIEKKEEKTKSGLYMPNSDISKHEEGQVLIVGIATNKEGQNVPLPVKEGDTIVFEKYAKQEIQIQGTDYHMLRADDIIAVIA